MGGDRASQEPVAPSPTSCEGSHEFRSCRGKFRYFTMFNEHFD